MESEKQSDLLIRYLHELYCFYDENNSNKVFQDRIRGEILHVLTRLNSLLIK
jgi:hypothetical protein